MLTNNEFNKEEEDVDDEEKGDFCGARHCHLRYTIVSREEELGSRINQWIDSRGIISGFKI
jgi:hypothetical protein